DGVLVVAVDPQTGSGVVVDVVVAQLQPSAVDELHAPGTPLEAEVAEVVVGDLVPFVDRVVASPLDGELAVVVEVVVRNQQFGTHIETGPVVPPDLVSENLPSPVAHDRSPLGR